MDRVSACGAEDTSSIPVGRTFKQKPVLKKSGYFFARINRYRLLGFDEVIKRQYVVVFVCYTKHVSFSEIKKNW